MLAGLSDNCAADAATYSGISFTVAGKVYHPKHFIARFEQGRSCLHYYTGNIPAKD